MRRRAAGGLGRDTLVYGVGLALQRGSSFLVLPAATRILGARAFGEASAALVAASFMSILFTVGINYGIVRLYFDEPRDARRTEWAALVRVQLLLAAALAGIAWLLGPAWSDVYENIGWSSALQAAVVLALAQAAGATALGVLRASGRVYAFASVVATQAVVGTIVAIVLAEHHGSGGLVLGLAVGAAAGSLLGLVLSYRRPKWSATALPAGLLLSVPFVAHMLSSWVLSLFDRIVIERQLGLEELATYQIAYAVALLPVLLSDAVQTAWLPRYYGFDAATKRGMPERLAVWVTLAGVGLAALFVLLGPALGRLLAPAGFGFPDTVVALVASVTFVRAPYQLAFAVLSDVKRSHAIAVASGIGAAVAVVACVLLIPEWGLNGAGAATLVAYTTTSLVAVRLAERRTGSSWRLSLLLGLWAIGVAALVLVAQLPTDVAGWTARLAISAMTVVALAVVLRVTRDRYRPVGAPAPA